MSKERWHAIKWNVRAVNSARDAPKVPKTHPEYDRLWKMRPLLDALLQACQRVMKPGRVVSLDEAMVKCKGLFFLDNVLFSCTWL
jgi:Transposase IS4